LIDIHSHVLYVLDDGARTMGDSVASKKRPRCFVAAPTPGMILV
jgi:hypothetical protein